MSKKVKLFKISVDCCFQYFNISIFYGNNRSVKSSLNIEVLLHFHIGKLSLFHFYFIILDDFI